MRRGFVGFCKYLLTQFREQPQVQAVCIPPGAKLSVFGIPVDLQRKLEVSENERVVFVQTNENAFAYRDAIRFLNGKDVLLQKLRPGIRMKVRSMGGDVEDTELIPSEVAYR
jgi:hypothetical protein